MEIAGLGVAVVAPCGYPLDVGTVAMGICALERLGCRVTNYFDPAEVYQRFGASDDARVGQIAAAVANPAIKVVMALRGGYGMTRIIDKINYEEIVEAQKIVVGFSDMTAFHLALLARTGSTSLAGPMVAGDFGNVMPSKFTHENFSQCLSGPTHAVRTSVTGNPSIEECGTIWGGNLTMVLSLLGTKNFPLISNGILFLEDVNEHPYRIERMLLQLIQSGVLETQRAVILGGFSGYKLSEADNGYCFDEMLKYIRGMTRTPILTGLQFGHGPDRCSIPVGAHCQLSSNPDGFDLEFTEYLSLHAASS